MGRLRNIVLSLLVLVAGGVPSKAAAEPSIRTMTLEEAIVHARAHQPRVRAALARVTADRADANVPRGEWLPVLGVSAQLFGATANNTTGTYVGRGGFDVPRIGGTRSVSEGTFQPYASTFAGAGVTQELFDFGRIAARAAALDALVDVEKQRLEATSLDVVFDVEEAYFAVLAAKAVLTASDDAFDRSRAHRDLARAGVNAGLRPPIDLTRAEAELTRLDIGRTRARGGLEIARTTLAAVVGVDDAELDAGAVPKAPPDMPALDAAMNRATARDPRLLETVAALRAEEQRTRAIGAESRPDLALTATFSGRAGGAPPSGNGEAAHADGFLPNVANWDAGLVFSWPLWSGVVRAREDASRAREEVRQGEIALARHELLARVRLAYTTVNVARSAVPGLGQALEAAKANYAQAEARFKGGLGTIVELADAEAVRTDAEIQLGLGQFALARARAVFGRTIAESP